jgi:hypothetical protein
MCNAKCNIFVVISWGLVAINYATKLKTHPIPKIIQNVSNSRLT